MSKIRVRRATTEDFLCCLDYKPPGSAPLTVIKSGPLLLRKVIG